MGKITKWHDSPAAHNLVQSGNVAYVCTNCSALWLQYQSMTNSKQPWIFVVSFFVHGKWDTFWFEMPHVDKISIFTEKVQDVLLGKKQYHIFFNLNVHVGIGDRERSYSNPVYFIKALSPKASLLCYSHKHPVRVWSCWFNSRTVD